MSTASFKVKSIQVSDLAPPCPNSAAESREPEVVRPKILTHFIRAVEHLPVSPPSSQPKCHRRIHNASIIPNFLALISPMGHGMAGCERDIGRDDKHGTVTKTVRSQMKLQFCWNLNCTIHHRSQKVAISSHYQKITPICGGD